jgi:superfamily II DNA/RNA helicase
VKEIMRHCNPEVQTVLFSATVDAQVDKLVRNTTRKPIRISADPDNVRIGLFRKQQKNCTSR